MSALGKLQGTRWSGTCELWEDPLGDTVQKSDCTVAIDDDVLTYTWSYKGKAHAGKLALREDGAEFSDSWHQAEPVMGRSVPDSWALVTVQYTYMEEWGWRIGVCLRTPTGELVVQMTNIAPWGEEVRAVRMVCKQD